MISLGNAELDVKKTINTISIIFALISIFQFYNEYEVLLLTLKDGISNFDFSVLLFIIPLFLLPISIVFIYYRKKVGWSLFAIYLTYSTVSSLRFFIHSINREPLDIPALENIFPQISPSISFLMFSFFSAALYSICKKSIREVFYISNIHMYRLMGIVAFVSILISYGMFY